MAELMGYDNFARDIKQLIHDKQYRALQMLNTETVALYWSIGREIYRQQQEKGLGKIRCRNARTGSAAGVSGREGIFGRESLAHA